MCRDQHIARIRKLRQMTQANGCSEAEAVTAAELAAQLIAAAGLNEATIDRETQGSRSNAGRGSVRLKLWAMIAYCTNTALTTLYARRRGGCRPTFTGQGGRPEIADYLRVVCDRAIDSETRRFKTTSFYRHRRSLRTKRQAVYDFTNAMCGRLITKLLTLFAEQIDEECRKTAVALRDAEFENGEQTDVRDQPVSYWEAIAAGSQAGERIELSHGIGGSQHPARLAGPKRLERRT